MTQMRTIESVPLRRTWRRLAVPGTDAMQRGFFGFADLFRTLVSARAVTGPAVGHR